MAFDLGELLKDVSKPDTGREQIEYIKLELIDGDEQNFYELSEVEGLANNIATIGLQQPLRVRIHPESEGRYKVVSGHRRRVSLLLLAKEDPEKWAEIACIVDRDNVSPALQQLRLIFGNSNTRKMSSADLSEQAAQVEKLLYQLKEEGYEFPGRMRDHVAQVVQASQTKLARLKMLRDNLAPCWQASFKKSYLSESTAYELARLPKEDQSCIFDAKKETGANIRWLYADDVKEYAERLNAIKKLKCSKFEKEPCRNAERKRLQTVKKGRYYNSPCAKCCSVCENLASCKNACPYLADKIRQIKADKKEANRQAKLAQEEKDRPAFEFIRKVYARVGILRKEKNMSVKALYAACKRYYWSDKDKEQKDLEAGTAKITLSTPLPYGRSFYFSDAESVCGVADALGCSVDYLLCRTDIREMAQVAPQEPAAQADPSSIELSPVRGILPVWSRPSVPRSLWSISGNAPVMTSTWAAAS